MIRKGLGKNKGQGYKNIAPMDSHIHSLSAKGVKTYKSLTDFKKDVKKGNVYDSVTIGKTTYTQDFYDLMGKEITYGNKKQNKGIRIETKDRYKLGFNDANIVYDDSPLLRNDVTYLDAKGKVKDLGLSYEIVNSKSRMFDFSEGYGDTWDVAVDQTEEEMENEEYVPMMNYIYPLPEDFIVPKDIKKKLNNMTVVYLENEQRYYLALTGGGMDMSWQIAETYVNLGYYPPTEYCDLPDMAGMNLKSPKNKKIIEACKNSLLAQKERGERGINRLDELGDN